MQCAQSMANQSYAWNCWSNAVHGVHVPHTLVDLVVFTFTASMNDGDHAEINTCVSWQNMVNNPFANGAWNFPKDGPIDGRV